MRNLLFIGVDQLRHDAIWPHKALPVETPNMDRLMRGGVSFGRTYATSPLCTPSRGSMLTGDYAFTHGMGTNCDMYHALGRELADPGRLLHHDLGRAGYRCGFVGKWHVGVEKGPADYGFEGDVPPGYGNLAGTDAFKSYLEDNGLGYTIEPELYFNPGRQTLAAGRWRGPQRSTPCHFQSNQIIEMLEGYRSGDAPFFATVQYWDPHGPHLISDEFHRSTDRSRIVPWPNFADDLSGKPRRVKRERDDFYRLHPRTQDELVAYIGYYCDHVAMLDYEIGRLLDYLEASGLAQSTLIVFTSDHGDMTGAHGGLIDKGLPYEEAMRVPMVFSHPDLGSGERSGLALNMDILPTALSLLGVAFAPRQAIDLSAQIRDSGAKGRDYLLAEYHGLRFLYSQRILVSDDNLKLVFSPGDLDEVYDLARDPHEMDNLAQRPERADDLVRLRLALMKETARHGDPLRDCVSKFNGRWRTGSGQFDATAVFEAGRAGS
ncbi:sulfatase-like hydrolase/transferase [Pelagibacterium halotolerans]|uniref:sulfatase-like hydrolase/transferase n=1 Tax=Pelagibacterium halotolerans TaxID=531813 RepID=UPI000A061439|nr:sulfatase-like hydrolase/transferase [Pelagibacterium halotolerans]QJR17269.1 sulfatase-like hydrolase/transferase [Pelagibacterium halotolerans]